MISISNDFKVKKLLQGAKPSLRKIDIDKVFECAVSHFERYFDIENGKICVFHKDGFAYWFEVVNYIQTVDDEYAEIELTHICRKDEALLVL